MPTFIISLCDPHFSDKKPRSRRDDFIATQRRKLNDVMKLAGGFRWKDQLVQASAIAVGGDMFHQAKGRLISRSLDQALCSQFKRSPCPILAIAGNHDMDRDRLESLKEHPLGTLAASGLVKLVHWPDYVVIGGVADRPPVIVTGKQYVLEGPRSWLDMLRETQKLAELKAVVHQDYPNAPAQAFVMTHNFWGPVDAMFQAEPILGHHHAAGTGANVILYGHPHTFDGTTEVEDGDYHVSVVGPGALIRGTIAEKDVRREPRIAITAFNEDGTHEVMFVKIPHEPAESVFDLEQHERVRRERTIQERFVRSLEELQTAQKKPEDILAQAERKVPMAVVTLARSYLTQAEAEV